MRHQKTLDVMLTFLLISAASDVAIRHTLCMSGLTDLSTAKSTCDIPLIARDNTHNAVCVKWLLCNSLGESPLCVISRHMRRSSICRQRNTALFILPASLMASNFSICSANTAGIPDFAGVIIHAYAEVTSPILTLLVLYAVLGAICLPLLLAVFYFSTSRIRQTPLFIIVVFDIFLGIAISFWMTTTTVRLIPGCLIICNLTDGSQFGFLLRPLAGFPRTSFIAVAIVTFLSPWVIDLVLILRLYAVFPVATTPRRKICAVFAFTACIKMARLGFGIANAALWVPTVAQDPSTAYSPSNSHSVHSSWQKAAAACDLIDHMCVELASSEVWRRTTTLILALLLLASYGSCVSASVHCSVPCARRVRWQVSTVAASA
jgi:hypothetical protein